MVSGLDQQAVMSQPIAPAIRRFPADLSQFVCWDSCTVCGQPFMYLDEEIRGTHVLSPKELEVAWVQES